MRFEGKMRFAGLWKFDYLFGGSVKSTLLIFDRTLVEFQIESESLDLITRIPGGSINGSLMMSTSLLLLRS